MKFNYLLFLILFYPINIFSQNIDEKKIFLDSLKNETSDVDFFYYRIISKSSSDNFKVSDFYKSGQIAMTGNYADEYLNVRNGEYIYFYENGNKKEVINYDKNVQLGVYNSWYENGNKKEVGINKFIDEKTKEMQFLTFDFWDNNNNHLVENGNGYYNNDNSENFSKGKIVNGLKDSIWIGADKILKYKYSEKYENGNFKGGQSIDVYGVSHKYDLVRVLPVPKRGLNDFYKFIGKNFKNPYIKGFSGKLIINFVIDINGQITEAKVIKKIGNGADEEGLRVINSYSKWIPATFRGVNVRCTYSIPISVQEPE